MAFSNVSILRLDGRGAIFGNLFCKEDNNPSGNKKFVSWGVLGGSGI